MAFNLLARRAGNIPNIKPIPIETPQPNKIDCKLITKSH